MARVITFSRTFPAYHPKAGESTYFVESILQGIGLTDEQFYGVTFENKNYLLNTEGIFEPKHHTIRNGMRWKPNNIFSPAVWGTNINPKSGRSGAYHSKQIKFAPDIEVKKTWHFIIDNDCLKINGLFHSHANDFSAIKSFAQNDGLTPKDLLDWFQYPKKIMKESQIICWNENINY